MIQGCLLFLVQIIPLFVLHITIFDGHMASTCHDWQVTCRCVGIDGFKLKAMPIHQLDLIRGHEMDHWTNQKTSLFDVSCEGRTIYSHFFEVCSHECHQWRYIGWPTSFLTLLGLIWITGPKRHWFNHDGLLKMKEMKWFQFPLTHWLCSWWLKLCLVALQPQVIYLLEQYCWRNILPWLKNWKQS